MGAAIARANRVTFRQPTDAADRPCLERKDGEAGADFLHVRPQRIAQLGVARQHDGQHGATTSHNLIKVPFVAIARRLPTDAIGEFLAVQRQFW
jgi:hypothetical protein